MERTTQQPQKPAPQQPRERPERQPTWTNTHPRENQPIHSADLARGIERLETVLGR